MSKAHKKESQLQDKVIEWCKQENVLHINIHGGGWTAKGCPDLILCDHGWFIAVELKVRNNTRSDAQILWERKVKQSKGHYILAYSLEEFVAKIQEVRYARQRTSKVVKELSDNKST